MVRMKSFTISFYSERIRQNEEATEEMYEKRIQILMDAYENQGKKQNDFMTDEEDEWVSSILFYQEKMRNKVDRLLNVHRTHTHVYKFSIITLYKFSSFYLEIKTFHINNFLEQNCSLFYLRHT